MNEVINNESQLVRYNAMILAINECHKVDEAKNIRDKAQALASYAKQAKNIDAELQATEIRLRAERQCGVLLKAREMNKGAATPSRDTSALTLDDLGISYDQSSRFQKLADIPDKEFESHFNVHEEIKEGKVVIPSTGGILRTHKQSQKPKEDLVLERRKGNALRVWGRVRDLRDMCEATNVKEAVSVMSDTMKEDIPIALQQIIPWITELQKELNNEQYKN